MIKNAFNLHELHEQLLKKQHNLLTRQFRKFERNIINTYETLN